MRTAHAFCRALAPWRAADPLQCRRERAHGRYCAVAAPAGAAVFSISAAMPSLRIALRLPAAIAIRDDRLPRHELRRRDGLKLQILARHVLDALGPREIAGLGAHQRQEIALVLQLAHERLRAGFELARLEFQVIGVEKQAREAAEGQ